MDQHTASGESFARSCGSVLEQGQIPKPIVHLPIVREQNDAVFIQNVGSGEDGGDVTVAEYRAIRE